MNDRCDIPAALVSAFRDARHVCVLTGAGVSAESGVPTFREASEGLWAKHNPLDLATPEAFLANPELIWQWYRWRRGIVADAQPNPGHYALARLAELVPRFTLVTQNVDNLHRRAGSRDVIEFHGNLFEDRCFVEGTLEIGDHEMAVPTCPTCGAQLRPGVVWFGESIPEQALRDACDAALSCDIFLSIGTSALVYPAAGLADLARNSGAIIVEINPNPTEQAAACDFALDAKSGVALPELVDLLSL